MAKVKLKSREPFKKLAEKFSLFKTSREDVTRAGQILQTQIIADTKKGKTATGDNLKPLESSTIRNRRYLTKYNQPDELYREKKSNLTITGDLLKKVKHRIDNAKSFFGGIKDELVIVFYSNENHAGYDRKNGKKSRGAKISTIMTAQNDRNNRKIIAISERSKKQIIQLFKAFLRRALTR